MNLSRSDFQVEDVVHGCEDFYYWHLGCSQGQTFLCSSGYLHHHCLLPLIYILSQDRLRQCVKNLITCVSLVAQFLGHLDYLMDVSAV